jgi:hypothetical protein
MRPHWVLLFPAIFALASRPLAQTPIPELRFTDPSGFYRSAIFPPADYSSQEVNASLQVYPFRVVNGDIRQAFSRTLLRELIDARYQETSILPGGRMDQVSSPAPTLCCAHDFKKATTDSLVNVCAWLWSGEMPSRLSTCRRLVWRVGSASRRTSTPSRPASTSQPIHRPRRLPLHRRAPPDERLQASTWRLPPSTKPSSAAACLRCCTTCSPPMAASIASTTISACPETIRRGSTLPPRSAPIR